MRLHIEAVTVCVGYADFLAHTIPYNQSHFDRWVIVTSPQDRETQEVCRRHSMECIVTKEFYKFGNKFNKGAGINKGLAQLSHDGWIVHLDADIILPRHYRRALEAAQIDDRRDAIYGADRLMVKSYADWKALEKSGYLHGWPQHGFHNLVRPSPQIADWPRQLRIGDRWADWRHGWCPIGYYQQWHGDNVIGYGVHNKPYPTAHNGAERTDVQFALQWDRNDRIIIPEFVVIHLESEPAKLGANWKGRTTARFEAPQKKH